MSSFRPLHKFGEYIPSGSYAYPIKDGDRTASQMDREKNTKIFEREALLEQMKYNKFKANVEKEQELLFG